MARRDCLQYQAYDLKMTWMNPTKSNPAAGLARLADGSPGIDLQAVPSIGWMDLQP